MVETVFKVNGQKVNDVLQREYPPLAELMSHLDVHPELSCKASIISMGWFTLIELMTMEAGGQNHPEARVGSFTGWYLIDFRGDEMELYIVDDIEVALRRILDHERGCGERLGLITPEYIEDISLRFIGGSKTPVEHYFTQEFKSALVTHLVECGWMEPIGEPKDEFVPTANHRSVTSEEVGLEVPRREDVEAAYDNASNKVHCEGECTKDKPCPNCKVGNHAMLGGINNLLIPVLSIHEATPADMICLVNGYYADSPVSKVVRKAEVTFVFCKLNERFYALPPMDDTAHWVEFALEEWNKSTEIPTNLLQKLTLSDLVG